MDAVFRFQDVTLVRDGRIILDHISLEILPGEICTIIGPSGAGKSTLLSLFNRLQDPNRGEIFFQDRPLTQIDVLKLRRKVGMVFQLPSLFKGTVADNINFGPSLKSDKPVPKDNALPYLQMVGLEPEFLRLPADKLSVGQQQRISIARCLANKPEVLLMDEPTSALDTEAVSTIEELCVELHRKMDLTLVWVTHNLDQARRLGGKTILLDAGVIVKTGTAEEVIARMQADHNRVSPAVLEYLQDDQAGPDE
ncbi:MAG: phosphate ABC transporter ATP-binding protein [Dethiobacteria bacterium]